MVALNLIQDFPTSSALKKKKNVIFLQCRGWRGCEFDPWVRKIPEEGNGNPLHYSFLGNPMDRGA